MFKIDKEDRTTIRCTRGDKGSIVVKKKKKNGEIEPFYSGDRITLSIKNSFDDKEVALRKEVIVADDVDSVTFDLTKEDTKIGDLISSPTKFQYDIAINDDITILGYDDETGAKYFILYPEGSSDN